MPAGDLDGEIVAGLGTQPCPGRVDQKPAGLWSEPVGTGNLHGRRLRRRRDARCAAEATVTMGDQEGHRRVPGLRTWLHPTALSASLRRRPGPSAIARRNHAVRRPTSLVWRSLVGITSKSTHTSKQRPAAVHHLISRSPAQLQRSLRPALKRAAAVNTRQSRAGPRRCDRVHQHPHLCDRHRPTFLRTRYCVDLTASPVMRPPAGWDSCRDACVSTNLSLHRRS
jgi:hypothetical protein